MECPSCGNVISPVPGMSDFSQRAANSAAKKVVESTGGLAFSTYNKDHERVEKGFESGIPREETWKKIMEEKKGGLCRKCFP